MAENTETNDTSTSIIGCATPTQDDPDMIVQVELLNKAGCDKILKAGPQTDNHESRTRTKADLLRLLRPGDRLVLTDAHQISQTLDDFISFAAKLIDREIDLTLIAPDIDSRSAESKKLLHNLAAIERSMAGYRIKRGIAKRQEDGQSFGRRRKFTAADWPDVKSRLDETTVAEVARHFGCNRQTIYNFRKAMLEVDGRNPSNC